MGSSLLGNLGGERPERDRVKNGVPDGPMFRQAIMVRAPKREGFSYLSRSAGQQDVAADDRPPGDSLDLALAPERRYVGRTVASAEATIHDEGRRCNRVSVLCM